jgi:hypothetical protein
VNWYPEIAEALSPHTLADLFFDCLSDGQAGKSEYAGSIGMALGTALSILNITPEDEGLKALCNRIKFDIKEGPSSEQPFTLAVFALGFITNAVPYLRHGTSLYERPADLVHVTSIPDLSTTHKLWLSRVVLHTVWRCRRVQDPTTVLVLPSMDHICNWLMKDGGKSLVGLRTNCLLIMAIVLGLQIDIRDLCVPNNTCVVPPLFPLAFLIEW